MISVRFDNRKFRADMKNIMAYASGYVDGVKSGKQAFLLQIGAQVKEYMSAFIDSMAKANPEALHHMYEWYKIGQPSARLFDIEYTVSNLGLSFMPNYLDSNQRATQSQPGNVKDVFWDKARVMEEGVPVKIVPKRVDRLVFTDRETGEVVATTGPVHVDWTNKPTYGKFADTFNMFFKNYFSQAFLDQSGVRKYLENPVIFDKDIKKGKLRGRPQGYSTGMRFIFNAGIGGR